MIEDFIDSALIIDDSANEIEELLAFLIRKDIWVKHLTPEEIGNRGTEKFRNRRIIFLDLFLVDSDTQIGNIARIRRILRDTFGKNFGTYGIVLWTKHLEHLNDFRSKIALDEELYMLPLFIVGMDKSKYLAARTFDGVMEDLELELKNNSAATFFIKWSTFITKGRDNAVMNIYGLEKNYEHQSENIKFLLFQLAKNFSGIPIDKIGTHNITQDAVKAFCDLLNYEILSACSEDNFLFEGITELLYKYVINHDCYEYSSNNHIHINNDNNKFYKNSTIITISDKRLTPQKEAVEYLNKAIVRMYSEINSKLLIDCKNLKQDVVIPGNIYSVLVDSHFKISDDKLPPNATPIVIEVTPPCDFSNDKKGGISRIVSGFICDYSMDVIKSHVKGDYMYKEFWPIQVDNTSPKIIAFDFKYFGSLAENHLKNDRQYKLLFRAKDKLFADILQKLSSHTARLGLAVIR